MNIERKQEIPHEGPMCDLLWSDPGGKLLTKKYRNYGMDCKSKGRRLYFWQFNSRKI